MNILHARLSFTNLFYNFVILLNKFSIKFAKKNVYAKIYPPDNGDLQMIKIDTLPNYCNGKLYKRWDSVCSVYGQGSVIARKNDKKGIVELLLTDNGHKRELFYSDGKIMDTIDSKGIKRTYKYQRTDADTIEGEMIASRNSKGALPFILSAKWILKNMIPEQILVKVNPKHPKSKVSITNIDTKVFLKSGSKNDPQVVEILAKDFDNSYYPLPKTIIMKNVQGNMKTVASQTGEDNLNIARHFGIESEILGTNFRTIV